MSVAVGKGFFQRTFQVTILEKSSIDAEVVFRYGGKIIRQFQFKDFQGVQVVVADRWPGKVIVLPALETW